MDLPHHAIQLPTPAQHQAAIHAHMGVAGQAAELVSRFHNKAEYDQAMLSRHLGEHLNQVFDLMSNFQHVNELDPVTRELFRDLRGTLISFMAGVS